jgi:hypothetical protein
MSLLSGRSGELSRSAAAVGQTQINVVANSVRPVPFLMITNGGGVTEAERCKALSAELDVEVGFCNDES